MLHEANTLLQPRTRIRGCAWHHFPPPLGGFGGVWEALWSCQESEWVCGLVACVVCVQEASWAGSAVRFAAFWRVWLWCAQRWCRSAWCRLGGAGAGGTMGTMTVHVLAGTRQTATNVLAVAHCVSRTSLFSCGVESSVQDACLVTDRQVYTATQW